VWNGGRQEKGEWTVPDPKVVFKKVFLNHKADECTDPQSGKVGKPLGGTKGDRDLGRREMGS